jgi:hypothetical protein
VPVHALCWIVVGPCLGWAMVRGTVGRARSVSLVVVAVVFGVVSAVPFGALVLHALTSRHLVLVALLLAAAVPLAASGVSWTVERAASGDDAVASEA